MAQKLHAFFQPLPRELHTAERLMLMDYESITLEKQMKPQNSTYTLASNDNLERGEKTWCTKLEATLNAQNTSSRVLGPHPKPMKHLEVTHGQAPKWTWCGLTVKVRERWAKQHFSEQRNTNDPSLHCFSILSALNRAAENSHSTLQPPQTSLVHARTKTGAIFLQCVDCSITADASQRIPKIFDRIIIPQKASWHFSQHINVRRGWIKPSMFPNKICRLQAESSVTQVCLQRCTLWSSLLGAHLPHSSAQEAWCEQGKAIQSIVLSSLIMTGHWSRWKDVQNTAICVNSLR